LAKASSGSGSTAAQPDKTTSTANIPNTLRIDIETNFASPIEIDVDINIGPVAIQIPVFLFNIDLLLIRPFTALTPPTG